jgi:hypothetical protein
VSVSENAFLLYSLSVSLSDPWRGKSSSKCTASLWTYWRHLIAWLAFNPRLFILHSEATMISKFLTSRILYCNNNKTQLLPIPYKTLHGWEPSDIVDQFPALSPRCRFWDRDLISGLWTCKAGALLLEPCLPLNADQFSSFPVLKHSMLQQPWKPHSILLEPSLNRIAN